MGFASFFEIPTTKSNFFVSFVKPLYKSCMYFLHLENTVTENEGWTILNSYGEAESLHFNLTSDVETTTIATEDCANTNEPHCVC